MVYGTAGYAYVHAYGIPLVKYALDPRYLPWVSASPAGFLACGSACALVSYSGQVIWNVSVPGTKAAYFKDYWYVASSNNLIILYNGTIKGEMTFNQNVTDIKACANYLAVLTNTDLYLYQLSDPTSPKLVWSESGLSKASSLVFSPDCNYIAVADEGSSSLKVYDLLGNLVYQRYYSSPPTAVSWEGSVAAVGFEDGSVTIYEVYGDSASYVTVSTIIANTTVTSTYTTTTVVTTTTTEIINNTLTLTKTITTTLTLTKTAVMNSTITLIESYKASNVCENTTTTVTEYVAPRLPAPPWQHSSSHCSDARGVSEVLTWRPFISQPPRPEGDAKSGRDRAQNP